MFKFLKQNDPIAFQEALANTVIDSKEKQKIIQTFIQSEEHAFKHGIQGYFYSRYHYVILKIAKSTMSQCTAQEKEDCFFHLIRVGVLTKVDEKNFIYLQKAWKRLVPYIAEPKYNICTMKTFAAFLLFEIIDEKSEHQIETTNYAEYISIFEFVQKVRSYTSYPALRKKSDKLSHFLENTLLMQRICLGLRIFFAKEDDLTFFLYVGDFEILGAIVLLLMSNDKKHKDILYTLHTLPLQEKAVDFLQRCYEDFSKDEKNRMLLSDLVGLK